MKGIPLARLFAIGEKSVWIQLVWSYNAAMLFSCDWWNNRKWFDVCHELLKSSSGMAYYRFWHWPKHEPKIDDSVSTDIFQLYIAQVWTWKKLLITLGMLRIHLNYLTSRHQYSLWRVQSQWASTNTDRWPYSKMTRIWYTFILAPVLCHVKVAAPATLSRSLRKKINPETKQKLPQRMKLKFETMHFPSICCIW